MMQRSRTLIIALTAVLASCASRCGAPEPPSAKPPGEHAGAAARPGGASGCIDGTRAIEYIEELVALGPRHPGTEGAELSRRLIASKLEEFGLAPKRRDFTALTPHPDLKRVEMANITVDFPAPGGGKTILVGGHFDGKIIDKGVFRGANDGGSSTGLLLEMARCLAGNPPPVPVRLAFFDGEEAFVDWSDSDSLYGSKRMATDILEADEKDRFAAMINVDMIGDARLRIFRETLSTRWVFAILEKKSRELGYPELITGPRAAVEDDHVPFMRIGIPAANLIDLQFGPGWDSNGYWHTERDSVDKLDPKSIETVGQIVLESLPEIAAGPHGGD